MLNRRTGKDKKIKQMHPLPPQSEDWLKDISVEIVAATNFEECKSKTIYCYISSCQNLTDNTTPLG